VVDRRASGTVPPADQSPDPGTQPTPDPGKDPGGSVPVVPYDPLY
jgi:hypothetical protein